MEWRPSSHVQSKQRIRGCDIASAWPSRRTNLAEAVQSRNSVRRYAKRLDSLPIAGTMPTTSAISRGRELECSVQQTGRDNVHYFPAAAGKPILALQTTRRFISTTVGIDLLRIGSIIGSMRLHPARCAWRSRRALATASKRSRRLAAWGSTRAHRAAGCRLFCPLPARESAHSAASCGRSSGGQDPMRH
jgi:hypothetical protein